MTRRCSAASSPILRFTHGELFLPTPATRYVEACDLLTGTTPSTARVLVPLGDLNEETLAAAGDAPPGEIRFLRFVQAPLNPIELARFNNRPDRPRFKAPGRLARVGLLARMLDAGLVASLLVRGKVPGGTAAAAAIKYEAIRARDPRVSYHGRVIRAGRLGRPPVPVLLPDERLALDLRRSQRPRGGLGAGLRPSWRRLPDGDVEPVWFAAAAHDEQGADLRRRWDDPKLARGGRARRGVPGRRARTPRYMEQGEYIMRLAAARRRASSGHPRLGAPRSGATRSTSPIRATLPRPSPAVSVPFVDYARGDGLHGRPRPASSNGARSSSATTTPGSTPTAGLWGLDTGDRMAGERAPAGPKYTRTGTVRQSWNDPLSFVGLAGAPTPAETREALVARVAALRAERPTVDAEAAALAATLPGLSAEVRALAETSGVDAYRKRRAAELAEGEAKLASLRVALRRAARRRIGWPRLPGPL